MNTSDLMGPQLEKLQRGAVIAAALGLVLCGIGFVLPDGSRHFFESYLFAFLFVFGITLGSLALLMLGHVTGGGWSFILRRPLEAATRNFPLIALMLLPVLLGMKQLYLWADPERLAQPQNHELLETLRNTFKGTYLNPTGFIVRAIIYFAIWMTLTWLLNSWSRRQDATDDPGLFHKFQMLCAPGLLIYVLTMTFASFDWIMSLAPMWTSSLFGVVILAGQALSTFALMAILISRLAGRSELVQKIDPRYFRDIGNLTLAFTLFWAYTSFSQFMIMWSGNIAEEASWFKDRMTHGWGVIAVALIFLHFALPFLCLLSSSLKVNVDNLARLGCFIILMRIVDLWWYVVPTFRSAPIPALSDVGAPLLLTGVWLFFWAREIKGRPLLAQFDPRLAKFEDHPALQMARGQQVQTAQGVTHHG